jgi:hypothetical protein
MYFNDLGKHSLPHFHARYGEYEATFSINSPAWIAGVMPRRQINLILAWAEIHQRELQENWVRMRLRKPASKIEGLK